MVHHRRDCQTSTDTEDHIHARRRRIRLPVLPVADHSFIRYHNQQDPMIVNQLRASLAAPTFLPALWLTCLPALWLTCLPALWLTCLPALWLTPLSKLSLPSKHNCPMHKTPPITLSAVRSYCRARLYLNHPCVWDVKVACPFSKFTDTNLLCYRTLHFLLSLHL